MGQTSAGLFKEKKTMRKIILSPSPTTSSKVIALETIRVVKPKTIKAIAGKAIVIEAAK